MCIRMVWADGLMPSAFFAGNDKNLYKYPLI